MPTARTSESHPLRITAMTLGDGRGRIGFSQCPGRIDRYAISGPWKRDLDTDLDAIQRWGATAVVSLIIHEEIAYLKVHDLPRAVRDRHMEWWHAPIPDGEAPEQDFEHAWKATGESIRNRLRLGFDVLLHCRGGLGRAGTITARLLVELGVQPDDAIRRVRDAHEWTIENDSQLAHVRQCSAQAPSVPSRTADDIHDRALGAFLGPKLPPPRERLRQKIITLRKQNSSVYDIRDALDQSGEKLSPASISTILKEEGFARLPRRRDDERPATTRPNAADVADAGKLDLSERTFRTKVGGLFLFLPYLAKIPLDKMLADAKFPGTKMMPAAHAIRSLLAMKLFGSARHSHVMSYVFDEGLALFAGLNVIPKRSFLTEYSCRIRPVCYPQIMRSWFDTVKKLGLKRGRSLDLDFHNPLYQVVRISQATSDGNIKNYVITGLKWPLAAHPLLFPLAGHLRL